MIQFNLLPDVKLAFLKARLIKRLIVGISGLVGIVALVVFLLLFSYVDVAQKKHLSDLQHDVTATKTQLGDNTNLNKILTIQHQLQALPSLNAEKPVASRLFGDIAAVTPAAASISELNVDFGQNTMQIQGTADSLKTVNQFVDTLEFTDYKTGGSSMQPKAFSDVVLSSFGLQSTTGSSYTITLNFDPAIFDGTKNVHLVVPPQTTTRSVIGQPTNLFQKAPAPANPAANTSGSNQP